MIEGVTTAIVGFIFVCILFPKLVKNRTQFYAAFGMIVIMLFLVTFAGMFAWDSSFGHVLRIVAAFLQLVALVMIVLSTGGLSLKELTGEFRDALEVIRRGEEEKEIIIPLSGQTPKPRRTASIDEEDAEAAVRVVKPAAPAAPPAAPPGSGSIPLE